MTAAQVMEKCQARKATHRVALVYDEIMLKHKDIVQLDHPECPERISTAFELHEELGLLEECYRLDSRPATEKELLLIHSTAHVQKMKDMEKLSNSERLSIPEKSFPTYFTNQTYQCALLAAGSVLQLVDSVVGGEARSGVAIVRPPGHHAELNEACGFCLFNNVALAAKYALDSHGLKKILIVDWDIHHGNGTQHMFYDDPRVLYISLHRYDNGEYFPCSEDANYDKVGEGEGKGFNVNIPWNRNGMGDSEYLTAFLNLVMPISLQFNPDLVLVSAGFDAAKGDPLGECSVSPECYGHMTHLLSSLSNGKVILALEGGYNLSAIANSMTSCTKALLGHPIQQIKLDEVDPVAADSINNVLDTQAKLWSVLAPFRK